MHEKENYWFFCADFNNKMFSCILVFKIFFKNFLCRIKCFCTNFSVFRAHFLEFCVLAVFNFLVRISYYPIYWYHFSKYDIFFWKNIFLIFIPFPSIQDNWSSIYFLISFKTLSWKNFKTNFLLKPNWKNLSNKVKNWNFYFLSLKYHFRVRFWSLIGKLYQFQDSSFYFWFNLI